MADVPERTAVLLDRHPLWLDAVERVLATMRVRTVAATGRPAEAMRAVATHRPDLLVVDPDGDDGGGDALACVREARALVPSLRVVALASSEDPDAIASAFAAGVAVYVVKRTSPADLVVAIGQAFESSIFIHASAQVAARTSGALPSAGLTRRELEILRLVADGQTNAQAARTLWVTEQTVKFHLANVYRKIGVANRTEAGRWAQIHGLLDEAADGRPARS